MHDDAWYYVDVQRQGFFRIGPKLYFCDFFSQKLKKKCVFLNVVYGVLISEGLFRYAYEMCKATYVA